MTTRRTSKWCSAMMLASAVTWPSIATAERHHMIYHPMVPSPSDATFRGGGDINMEKDYKTMSTSFAGYAGIILALNSGYLNGCCLSGLLGSQQAVAAVTGAYTTAAVHLMQHRRLVAAQTPLCILGSYMAGSAVAGLLCPSPRLFELSEELGPAFVLGAVLLVLATQSWEKVVALDGTATAAAAGATLRLLPALCLVTVANGLQNSLTSAHTANLIRTAHMSGMSSDMGTYVGQWLRGYTQNVARLRVFATLTLSFFCGGALSVLATDRLGIASLLLSAGLYLAIGLSLILHSAIMPPAKTWAQRRVAVDPKQYAVPI